MNSGTRRWSVRAALVALAAMLLLTPVWGQSVAQLRAEVNANPGSVIAWVALGNAYFKGSEYELAKDAYLEAIALDYSSGDAHYGLGLSEFSLGDYQAALFEFTEVTRLYPERFDGHFNRAVTLARLRQPAEAAKAFEQALAQAEPEATVADRAQAQLGLAAQRELSGDWKGAADAYAAAIELDPNRPDLVLRRGQALYQAGKGLEALPELTALEAESGDYRVSALISDIYVAQGQIDYGIWSLERALQKAEKANDKAAQASTLVKLGTLQRGLGRDTQARDSFARAVLLDPNSWEAQYDLGVSYLEAGQTREAVGPLQEAKRLEPSRGEVYLALASAQDQLANSSDALANAREALARLSDPELLTDAHLIAGRALYRLGDYAAARPELEAVLRARPGDPQVQMWAGLAAYQQGEYAAAIRAFERAAELSPASVEARVNLGAGYLAAQRYVEAERIYQDLVTKNPSDSDSLYNLGWSLYSQDRRGSARDAWVAACKLGYQPACDAISKFL